MKHRGPGFVVLYRWKLLAGSEDSFIEAWSRIPELLREQRGSLGSRLHRGSDGVWYGYAQWPSAEARLKAFAAGSVDPESSKKMREAVIEEFPEIVLDSVSDFLVLPSK